MNDFDLTLDFQRGSRDPSRVFYGMGQYIDSFNALDASLTSLFCVHLDSHLLLEDIRTGSLKAKLRRILNAVDDSALKDGNWKQVLGIFLHRAKHRLLSWCDENPRISDPQLVVEEAAEISTLAEATGLQIIPAYAAFTPQALMTAVQSIRRSGHMLHESDALYYTAEGETIQVSRRVELSVEVEETFLLPQKDVTRHACILVVKKPDYLGDSQWDFKLGGHPIRAHIRDDDWLSAFRNRRFDLKPGDALRVLLTVKRVRDGERREESIHYEVAQVRGIVPAQDIHQAELPRDDPPEASE